MSLLYLDTSAWQKLYVEETGTGIATDLVDEAEIICTRLFYLAAGEALALQVMPMPTLFASFDCKLNQAAKALGLAVLPLP